MNSAIDKLISNAISESQRMVELMTASCPGGAYDEYVKDSNEVVKQLNEIKLGLAKGQTSNAGPQIDAFEILLEKWSRLCIRVALWVRMEEIFSTVAR